MAPPKYKDLGKKANDILNEDFKFEHTLELTSKLEGVTVKSTFADKGKTGLTGEIECKRAIPTVGDVTLKTDHAFADPKLIVENSKLVSGLKLKAEAPCLMEKLMKGIVLAPEYKHDLFMLTAKADTSKKSSVVDIAFAAGPATAGIKTTLKASGAVSDTEAAVDYKAGNISAFAKYEVDKKKATCSLHNSVTKELDVAMEVIADQQKPDMDLSLALGASYKVDDTSNIKGKVDKAGVINLCYTQKARKDLEMKVTAAINTGNLSGATAHKWGVKAILTM